MDFLEADLDTTEVEKKLPNVLMGLVWFDADFVTLRRLGRLVYWAPPGKRIINDQSPLAKLEQKLIDIRRKPVSHLTVRGLHRYTGSKSYMDAFLEVYWLPSHKAYIAVIYALGPPFEIYLQVDRQEAAKYSNGGEAQTHKQRERSNLLSRISPRELEVLQLLLAGHRNKTIAFELGISERTVETHRARLMKHLGTRSFAELIRVAVEAGIQPT